MMNCSSRTLETTMAQTGTVLFLDGICLRKSKRKPKRIIDKQSRPGGTKAEREKMRLWTVEVDGDWTDYADCFFRVVAGSYKEAWEKAIALENRRIIRIY